MATLLQPYVQGIVREGDCRNRKSGTCRWETSYLRTFGAGHRADGPRAHADVHNVGRLEPGHAKVRALADRLRQHALQPVIHDAALARIHCASAATLCKQRAPVRFSVCQGCKLAWLAKAHLSCCRCKNKLCCAAQVVWKQLCAGFTGSTQAGSFLALMGITCHPQQQYLPCAAQRWVGCQAGCTHGVTPVYSAACSAAPPRPANTASRPARPRNVATACALCCGLAMATRSLAQAPLPLLWACWRARLGHPPELWPAVPSVT